MSDEIQITVPRSHLLVGQLQHALLLGLLVPGAWALASPVLGDGQWLGRSDTVWFAAAIWVAVAHQVLVLVVWRTQLVFGALTRVCGKNDMLVWGILFLPLLLGRGLLVGALGVADSGSLGLPRGLGPLLGTMCLVPALYTFHSVQRYFGIPRALGGDHFRESYRRMPLVLGGAFRWSPNAMYAFGFLALWSIAFFADSRAAVVAALFQHAYIWVHMYCTEGPDIRLLHEGHAPQPDRCP